MFEVIANLLAWFYEVTHSYAGAIALLSAVIMVLLTPLTLKGTKSRLPLGTHFRRDDLLRIALVASDNRAASALVNKLHVSSEAGHHWL